MIEGIEHCPKCRLSDYVGCIRNLECPKCGSQLEYYDSFNWTIDSENRVVRTRPELELSTRLLLGCPTRRDSNE